MAEKEMRATPKQTTEKSEQAFQEQVARKAYELFERRGRIQGHDVEDWLEAERLVKTEKDTPAL